jgi:cyclopropane fatty-acyl-phospholipid synthase-like methyltransferase
MPANIDRDWDKRYQTGDTPWHSGRASKQLQRVLSEYEIPRGRALELGCGAGTNAVYLSQQGFRVTAVDCSATAIDEARQLAASTGQEIEWITGDVQNFGEGREPFDFVFDRGCWHCCRRVDLRGYLRTHENATRSGSWFLCLAGNANEQTDTEGPPRVTEVEVATEFSPLYRIVQLREFHFEDSGGSKGPLGWSCLMQRR